ncbi:MAG TPA: serine/threonine-protein kinase [Polyangia bacterium]
MLQLTYLNRQLETEEGPPRRIGRYQLIGRLAKGGMAEAYLGICGELPGLHSLVVVKRILPHLSSNEQFVRMFFDEARIGTLLEHPNVVRIIEVGRDREGYFLAMEPVQGKPLSALLRKAARRKSPLGHAEAAFIVGQAADGLGYAHGLEDAEGHPLNVVHRDVSPENILVSFEGAVKVIDFGIASALGRLTETVPGGLKGKIEYMSPEQASGGAIDGRSDVFALGAVLWEALSGRRLFRRETELETMRAIVDEPVPRLPRAAGVSPRLERIVMRALQKDPEDRFADAREMALLLHRHAYASEGFSPAGLAAQMKRLFARDLAGWKAAARAALAIGGERSHKVTGMFSPLANIDSQTGGPTVSLYVGSQDDPASDAGERSAPGSVVDLGPPKRSWLKLAGGVAFLGLVVTAGLMLPRPRAAPSLMFQTGGQTGKRATSESQNSARSPVVEQLAAAPVPREIGVPQGPTATPPPVPPPTPAAAVAPAPRDVRVASAAHRRSPVRAPKRPAHRRIAAHRAPAARSPARTTAPAPGSTPGLAPARPAARNPWQDPFQ